MSEDRKELADRLEEAFDFEDHERGCAGRCYECSCGYDLRAAEVAREAVRALRQEPSGWQPIETAPKDGCSVLAICGTAYSPLAGVTWWQDGWTHYSRPAEKWHGGVGKWFPTHWMPLPAPPEANRRPEE